MIIAILKLGLRLHYICFTFV